MLNGFKIHHCLQYFIDEKDTVFIMYFFFMLHVSHHPFGKNHFLSTDIFVYSELGGRGTQESVGLKIIYYK